MNQKQLTKSIREGLNQSSDDFIEMISKCFIWAICIFVVGILIIAFLIMPLWNKYDK